MFIGHYGVGMALKQADKKIPLGLLFLSVSLIDLLHFFFVLIGIESIEIIPGYTEWIPVKGLNPYTHSLAGMLFWSVLTYIFVIIYGHVKKKSAINFKKTAVILSIGVFSHFICDVIVHIPDLPIAGVNTTKLGLGLWNYPIISNAIEIGMFISCMIIYMKATNGKIFSKKYGITIFGIILIAYHLVLGLIPPLDNIYIVYSNMLITCVIIIAVAQWLDRKNLKAES